MTRLTIASALLLLFSFNLNAQDTARETHVPKDVLHYGSNSNEANRAAAAEYAKRMNIVYRNLNNDPLITERGPLDVGGRTRGILFDPNDQTRKKVWAGGVTGGLWYTNDITNANTPWKNVGDVWANLSVTDIAYDPNDPKRMFVSTGERFGSATFKGAGLWKSTNGGNSWYQIPETAEPHFEYIRKVTVTRKGTLFIVTYNGEAPEGVFRSTDDGKTWTNVLPHVGSDIEITADGDIVAATINWDKEEGYIHLSTFEEDGAPGTWDLIGYNLPPCLRLELAVAPSDDEVIYAVGATSEKTEWGRKTITKGGTWTEMVVPQATKSNCTESEHTFANEQGLYDLIAAVSPEGSNVVFLGGLDLHRSDDGGETWSLIGCRRSNCAPPIHADHHEILFRPSHPKEMVFGTDGGVYYSKNAGDPTIGESEFIQRNKHYNVTQFYCGTMENKAGSNMMIAGAQDNGTHLFSEPGFGPTKKLTGEDGVTCFIDQGDSEYIITTSQLNKIHWSKDGGENFKTVSDYPTLVFDNAKEYDNDGKILYMAGDNQELWVSYIFSNPDEFKVKDIGLESGGITSIKASPYTANRLMVGSSKDERLVTLVEHAHLDNMTYTNITGNLKLNQVEAIDIGESENRLLVVGLEHLGPETDVVWETLDGGDSWVSKQGDLPEGMAVNWCLYNPNNRDQVMLATEAGVWVTVDITQEEPEWHCFTPNFHTKHLSYRESDGLVALATYGRGLWTTEIFSPNACKDVYEPNDDWKTEAKPIIPGQLTNGTIHEFLDSDFYSFSIEGNNFDPPVDISVFFQNKFNLGSVVSILKIENPDDPPVMLANEIGNQPVFYDGATPGDYLIWIWGGFSPPETYFECYNLQLELEKAGEGGDAIANDKPFTTSTTEKPNPKWLAEDEWLSKAITVEHNANQNLLDITAMSLGNAFSVHIQSPDGRTVLEDRFLAKALGETVFQVPLKDMPAGTYMVEVNDGRNVATRRVDIGRTKAPGR